MFWVLPNPPSPLPSSIYYRTVLRHVRVNRTAADANVTALAGARTKSATIPVLWPGNRPGLVVLGRISEIELLPFNAESLGFSSLLGRWVCQRAQGHSSARLFDRSCLQQILSSSPLRSHIIASVPRPVKDVCPQAPSPFAPRGPGCRCTAVWRYTTSREVLAPPVCPAELLAKLTALSIGSAQENLVPVFGHRRSSRYNSCPRRELLAA